MIPKITSTSPAVCACARHSSMPILLGFSSDSSVRLRHRSTVIRPTPLVRERRARPSRRPPSRGPRWSAAARGARFPRRACALCPSSCARPSNCTTAAPRPIVAIVPLSLVGERLRLLARRGAGRSSRRRARPTGARPSRAAAAPGRVFASVIAAMSPTTKTSGWPGSWRSGPTGDPVARAASSSPSEWTIAFALQARAPDERVRLQHLARLQRHARRRDRRDRLAGHHLDGAARRAPSPRRSRRFGLNIGKSSGPASTRISRAFGPARLLVVPAKSVR